jgi:hypothetical protein
MKEKISPAVVVVVLVIVGIVVAYFGWRKITGGPDADVTQESINRYQNMAKQTFGGGGAGSGGAGQMTHGAPPPKAAANSAANSAGNPP